MLINIFWILEWLSVLGTSYVAQIGYKGIYFQVLEKVDKKSITEVTQSVVFTVDWRRACATNCSLEWIYFQQ